MDPAEQFGSVDEFGHYAIAYFDGIGPAEVDRAIADGIIDSWNEWNNGAAGLCANHSRAVIVHTSCDGFIFPQWYDSADKATAHWNRISSMLQST
jgi:hypothetical protein